MDRGVELVEDARDAEEQRRLRLREVVEDLVDALRDRHARAHREEPVQLDGLPEDVEKDAEANLQKIHDKKVKSIEEILATKNKEIMTV